MELYQDRLGILNIIFAKVRNSVESLEKPVVVES
jgi:hypothetical protein